MAEMIPDRMPSGASMGEKRVFELLQKLPDTCIAYYEPVVDNRYPDFVVIVPTLGLLVIEVKGWYPAHILRANSNEVVVKERGQERVHKHPIRQARDYMFRLMDLARRHPRSASLLTKNGAHAGRFAFPFGHVAVLSNIQRAKLKDVASGDEVFLHPRVLTRDELAALCGLPGPALIAKLKTFFNVWWSFAPLDEAQISLVRSIIHPEIILPGRPGNTPLNVLDLRQERNARSIGDGHRVIYGVAGSGKTVLLVSRARLLAEDPAKRLLILCFNRALAAYFQEAFAGLPNICALNFHAWGGRHGIGFRRDEDEDDYGQRLLDRLEHDEGDAGQFDAVFIDEAQDFARTWFMCAKLALREPDDGDLLIVGDGGQSLYRRRPFSWRDAAINAPGRTINKRFDLDKNYRNTREILLVAAPFAITGDRQNDPEEALQIMQVDPGSALRHGVPPRMHIAASRKGECEVALSQIEHWLQRGLPTLADERAAIGPSEIAVLYPRLPQALQPAMRDFIESLQKFVDVYWANDPNGAYNSGDAVIVRTIYSSKGLQYRAVLILWSDLLPMSLEAEQIRHGRGLMYVAMTRAEDVLVLTRSGESTFTHQIEAAIAEARSSH